MDSRFVRIAAVAAIVASLAPSQAVAAQAPATAAGGDSPSAQAPAPSPGDGSGDTGGESSRDKVPDTAVKVTVMVDGSPVELSKDADGVWTGEARASSEQAWKDIRAAEWTSDDGSGEVPLEADASKVASRTVALGLRAVDGDALFTADGIRLTVRVSYTEGAEAKAGWDSGKEDTPFVLKDGVWTAVLPQDALDASNVPAHDAVSVAGTKTQAEWSDPKLTVNDKGVAVWTRSMRAEGEIDGVKYAVTGEAVRQHDMHVALTVTRTGADGKAETIPVPGTDVTDPASLKDAYTLDPQDWGHVSDSYTLSGANGPDASFDKPSYSLGSGADRVVSQKVEWTDASGEKRSRTVTVTIPFQHSQEEPESPAQLEGIYVNLTGAKTKGDLIEGWNPRIHKYVIQIGENDPSPYILPVGADTVSVKAGDVLQTAYTATQTWTVSVKAGDESTSYQVTVVRAHSTPTADEAFTPGEAKPEPATRDAASDEDTGLVSWGWRGSDGVYHASDSDTFEIPEGGVVAWEAKKGQTVTNTVVKTAPMRYTHDLGVLAPDGTTFHVTELHVTYITADTHRAELTGLTVNGRPVDGFDPATTAYTVGVDDPSSWTVVPSYDKRLGMSVATHRDGVEAKVTVTSADGLTSRTYTVTATRRATLPDTGVDAAMGLWASLAVVLSAGLALLTRRLRG